MHGFGGADVGGAWKVGRGKPTGFVLFAERAGQGDDVVVTGREVVDAKLSAIIGRDARRADRQEPPASGRKLEARQLHKNVRRRIAELVEQHAPDRRRTRHLEVGDVEMLISREVNRPAGIGWLRNIAKLH